MMPDEVLAGTPRKDMPADWGKAVEGGKMHVMRDANHVLAELDEIEAVFFPLARSAALRS